MVEEVIFGHAVFNSVLDGGKHKRGKQGMFLIAEAMK